MSEEILSTPLPVVDAPTETVAEAAAAEIPAEVPVQAAPAVVAPHVAEADEPEENFEALLAEFEGSQSFKTEGAANQKEGTVVSMDAEAVYVDIGYKTEGMVLKSAFANNAENVAVGDKLQVTVTGRNVERYYELSLVKVAQPKDWSSLQEAFDQKAAIAGTVTGVVKGGLTVDIGVRAFMPSSRSGTRDAAEMEKLVGQTVAVRITKLDTEDEDVVVDRRAIVEEQAAANLQTRLAELGEGSVVSGTVRSLMAYGAFVDLGGVDGLLHISDIAWSRVNDPADVLTVGQELKLKVLSVDAETKRISLGLKQLQAEPWEAAATKYETGQRITGTVTRLTDFGAFVELEPGIEGLIHVSEMSWVKKVRKPSDMLKAGETVDAVVLSVDAAAKRISLGLKQALGDPWADVAAKFPVGTEIEGPVTKLMNFGAFVQVVEGVEGLVHVSEIAADRHVNHPSDLLRVGQVVKAQVMGIDAEKRQIKLSMKQLVPTGLSEYLVERKVGDKVSGRVVELKGDKATVELGEGIRATCVVKAAAAEATAPAAGTLDLSSLTSLLNAKWKTGAGPVASAPEPLSAGQVRSFKITKLDVEAKVIELELA
jgi:small subunit ribosomal protein S1